MKSKLKTLTALLFAFAVVLISFLFAPNTQKNVSASANETIRPMASYYYLDIYNQGYVDGKWQILVANNSNMDINFEYNTYMCTEGDAKNWTGLSDLKVEYLQARTTMVVYISESWASGYITFCYLYSGVRLITYANELTSSGGIAVYNRAIS